MRAVMNYANDGRHVRSPSSGTEYLVSLVLINHWSSGKGQHLVMGLLRQLTTLLFAE